MNNEHIEGPEKWNSLLMNIERHGIKALVDCLAPVSASSKNDKLLRSFVLKYTLGNIKLTVSDTLPM